MIGFATDAHGDWVARLSCGHDQHVRHDPPFTTREWVTTPEGRAGRLGQMLDCVRCVAFELPSHFVAYKRTATFDQDSVPAGLRKDHATKAGVWARIVVERGRLRYHVEALGQVFELSPELAGIVVPEVPHHVEPRGAVSFHVEFYRAP
ncbi:MAG: DUF3565 domain-containing protein [bacterium]